MNINEKKLNKIITENIKKYISESKKNNFIYDIIFVSYGTNFFNKQMFKKPTRHMYVNKPQGGFWGSPINSTNGWGEWADKNDFYKHNNALEKHILFKIKKGANIYVIDTEEDLKNISAYPNVNPEEIHERAKEFVELYKGQCTYEDVYRYILKLEKEKILQRGLKRLDFDKLFNEYDGIYITTNASYNLRYVANYEGLDSWDVESICVFNPDAMEIIDENAFDKAKVPAFEKNKHIDDYDEYDYFYDNPEKNNRKKQSQINKSYELYGNQNVKANSSDLFNGEHPGILAQGHGNNKKTKLARKYNGTIKSGL